MRDAAQAAHMSVGDLYHYFPTKRDLVLHGLRPEAFARLCEEFDAQWHSRRRSEPQACLSAFVEHFVTQVVFVRPSLHAALELGADTFWDTVDAGITAGLDEFSQFLQSVRFSPLTTQTWPCSPGHCAGSSSPHCSTRAPDRMHSVASCGP